MKTGTQQIQKPVLGAFSSDADLLAYVIPDGSIMIMDIQTGSVRKTVAGPSNAVKDIAISFDKKLLTSALDSGIVSVWNLEKGMQENSLLGHTETVNAVSFNSKGDTFASSGDDGKIIIWSVRSRMMIDSTTISGSMSKDPYQKQKYWSREKIYNKYNRRPAPPRALRFADEPKPRSLFTSRYSPSEEIVALGGYEFISLYNVNKRMLSDLTSKTPAISALAFSPEGTLMASGSENGRIDIWDMRSRKQNYSFEGHQGQINAIAFSSDRNQVMATAGSDKAIRLWDPLVGKSLSTISDESGSVLAITFGHQNTVIAAGSIDGTVNVWDVASSKREKVMRGHTSGVNSVVYTSTGKYLMSGSEDGTMIIWDGVTYERLATLIPGNAGGWLVVDPKGFFDGAQRALQLVPFRLPSEPLKLYEPEQFFRQFYQPGLLADIFREGKSISQILTARNDPRADLDISKYRNSKLPDVIIATPENGIKTEKREILVSVEVKDTGSGLRDVRVFRNQSLVHFEHGDLQADLRTKAFRIVVPVKLIAGQNEISAYAFNRDDLKSKDATVTITGNESIRRKGTAYILAVGLNHYSNSDWDLNYAVNDANSIVENLKLRFDKLGTYSQVVPITVLNTAATKENVLTALKLLSGDIISLPAGTPEELRKVRKAEPEDDIILYFSGHGMAVKDRYYLIPHAMGYQGSRKKLDKAGLQMIAEHGISDQELNAGFEKVDAGRIMLIIDACQSGQAMESEEKRRGPMNSRGLAQLAYEKGMYILAAAQSDQAAREFSDLKHGLLTYTLLEKGLDGFEADANKDNQIIAEEWLDYATQHLSQRINEANAKYIKEKGVGVDGDQVTITGQSPRAYYRRERVGDEWVVGIK